MTTFQAIIYGIIQGLTEFLPISSTAHIRIVPAFFGWADPGAGFTAITQIGTLIAVLVYFRHDILRMTRAGIVSAIHLRPMETPDSRMAWYIGIGTIPIVIAGLAFKTAIETTLRSLYVISATLIILALVLWLAEVVSKRRRRAADATLRDALLIGIGQACALIPGVSRSGITITTGLFMHFTREDAARFSFLLSIPSVLLSGVYQLWSLRHELGSGLGIDLVIAVIVSGIVGYASIEFLLRYLRTRSSAIFIIYRIALGIVILILLGRGILHP